MTTTKTPEQRTQDAIIKARGNLTVFKQVLYRRYLRAPHLDLLDRVLTQTSRYIETRGAFGINRLIIEMPPRHGKTLTTSRWYPTWHLGRNPNNRVMLVSYGATLSDKNSRMARNIIKSPYYQAIFPNVQLAADSRAVDSWDIAGNEGGADALGIDGGATGKGSHLLIIDDPVKNRAEAESETYRDKVWDSFTDDLYTRLEPNGVIIIMMTRWQQDDLAGRVIERMPNEGWKRLSLPAIAQGKDQLGREPGEPLWAARYPLETLQAIEEALGSYSWAALYQQSPKPSGGGLFKTERIKVYDYAPECRDIVRFYDLAVTAKKHADYTVGLKMGITADEEIIILDVYRAQREFPDIHEAIVQNAQLDGVQTRIRLEAEKAGIIGLDYLLRDSRMHPYTIDKKAPEGDKFTRALPFAARVEAGRVGIVKAAWNREYLDELAVFPNGAKDDQIDGSSGAYEMLAKGKMLIDLIWA